MGIVQDAQELKFGSRLSPIDVNKSSGDLTLRFQTEDPSKLQAFGEQLERVFISRGVRPIPQPKSNFGATQAYNPANPANFDNYYRPGMPTVANGISHFGSTLRYKFSSPAELEGANALAEQLYREMQALPPTPIPQAAIELAQLRPRRDHLVSTTPETRHPVRPGQPQQVTHFSVNLDVLETDPAKLRKFADEMKAELTRDGVHVGKISAVPLDRNRPEEGMRISFAIPDDTRNAKRAEKVVADIVRQVPQSAYAMPPAPQPVPPPPKPGQSMPPRPQYSHAPIPQAPTSPFPKQAELLDVMKDMKFDTKVTPLGAGVPVLIDPRTDAVGFNFRAGSAEGKQKFVELMGEKFTYHGLPPVSVDPQWADFHFDQANRNRALNIGKKFVREVVQEYTPKEPGFKIAHAMKGVQPAGEGAISHDGRTVSIDLETASPIALKRFERAMRKEFERNGLDAKVTTSSESNGNTPIVRKTFRFATAADAAEAAYILDATQAKAENLEPKTVAEHAYAAFADHQDAVSRRIAKFSAGNHITFEPTMLATAPTVLHIVGDAFSQLKKDRQVEKKRETDHHDFQLVTAHARKMAMETALAYAAKVRDDAKAGAPLLPHEQRYIDELKSAKSDKAEKLITRNFATAKAELIKKEQDNLANSEEKIFQQQKGSPFARFFDTLGVAVRLDNQSFLNVDRNIYRMESFLVKRGVAGVGLLAGIAAEYTIGAVDAGLHATAAAVHTGAKAAVQKVRTMRSGSTA